MGPPLSLSPSMTVFRRPVSKRKPGALVTMNQFGLLRLAVLFGLPSGRPVV
jgi:hypothetical protein